MSTTNSLFEPVTPPGPLPEPEATPPGSSAARRLGCICPSWLNGYGTGLRTACGAAEPGEYLAHPACRLHGCL